MKRITIVVFALAILAVVSPQSALAFPTPNTEVSRAWFAEKMLVGSTDLTAQPSTVRNKYVHGWALCTQARDGSAVLDTYCDLWLYDDTINLTDLSHTYRQSYPDDADDANFTYVYGCAVAVELGAATTQWDVYAGKESIWYWASKDRYDNGWTLGFTAGPRLSKDSGESNWLKSQPPVLRYGKATTACKEAMKDVITGEIGTPTWRTQIEYSNSGSGTS